MSANAKPLDFDEALFSKRAHQIYNRIKDDLVDKYRGKILALEPESGDYFTGDSKMEAAMQAKIKHPDKFFYFFRIGFEAMYKRFLSGVARYKLVPFG